VGQLPRAVSRQVTAAALAVRSVRAGQETGKAVALATGGQVIDVQATGLS
jgi:hypothetical protein